MTRAASDGSLATRTFFSTTGRRDYSRAQVLRSKLFEHGDSPGGIGSVQKGQ